MFSAPCLCRRGPLLLSLHHAPPHPAIIRTSPCHPEALTIRRAVTGSAVVRDIMGNSIRFALVSVLDLRTAARGPMGDSSRSPLGFVRDLCQRVGCCISYGASALLQHLLALVIACMCALRDACDAEECAAARRAKYWGVNNGFKLKMSIVLHSFPFLCSAWRGQHMRHMYI